MNTKIIFDTETTGLGLEDRIVQVGSIIYNDENEKLYDELCFTERIISEQANKVNGITNKDLENEKTFVDSLFYNDLLELNIKSNYLIAHNISFDLGMLEKEGFRSNFKLIDTKKLAEVLLDEDSYSLQHLRYSLKLNLQEKEIEKKYNISIRAHSAIGDVLVTKLLFDKLLTLTKEKYPDIDPYEKMSSITTTPRILESFPFGKYKGEKIADVYVINPGYIDWMLSLNDLNIDLKYSLEQVVRVD